MSTCRNRAPARREKSRASSSSSLESESSWRRQVRRSARRRSPPWWKIPYEYDRSAGPAKCRPAHRPYSARLAPGGGCLRDRHRGVAGTRRGVSRPGVPPAKTHLDRRRLLDAEERAVEPGDLHVQGGARRLCPRVGPRHPGGTALRRVATARRRIHALRGCCQRGTDHRVRPDHEQLVRAPEPVLEDGDRGRSVLLPGDDQHVTRADVRPSIVDRADAVLCGGTTLDVPTGTDSKCTPAHIYRVEGRDCPLDDRRDRRRVLP